MPNYQLLVLLADKWAVLTGQEGCQLTDERMGHPLVFGGPGIIGLYFFEAYSMEALMAEPLYESQGSYLI